MTDCRFGILRHQSLELGLGPLMIEEGWPRIAEERGKFRPRI
jgi:hypothetical protein